MCWWSGHFYVKSQEMRALLTPPFHVAGAGVLALEAVIGLSLVAAFWVTYPKGFAQLGAFLGALLLGCWLLAYSMSAKVRSSNSKKLESRARVALLVGAALGVFGLLLGLLSGPHLAGICAWGVIAQLLVLAAGRIALAI
jgi:hypothetical protein